MDRNEEFNNFMHRVNEVSSLVKDMSGGDKEKAERAKRLADQYLATKDVVIREGDDLVMTVKSDRTVINKAAFKGPDGDEGHIDKNAWMASVERDAAQRFHDRRVRRERAGTLKTQGMKAFRRGDYHRALSCYDRAIDQIKDDATIYCDRALTNIRLKDYQKVFHDCETVLKLNEKSYKARIYRAKAYKELEELEKFEECKKEIEEIFPQHKELTDYFLNKKEDSEDEKDENI